MSLASPGLSRFTVNVITRAEGKGQAGRGVVAEVARGACESHVTGGL